MTQRLDRPVTLLATFSGPVKIGKFDDGTILVAGPNDEPILIRNGNVMSLRERRESGDLEFGYDHIKAMAERAKADDLCHKRE